MSDIKKLRNEELITLLSFSESRQHFFLESGDVEAATTSREKDQNIKDEMVKRGINADTYEKYPRQ